MMNDRDFDNYLALLSGLLRLRSPQQSAIAQELRDHLVEHVAHLEAGGVAHDEAVRLALAEFGDAASLAANFSQLVRTRRRRMIMRLTVGSACVLAGLTIGIVALRPDVPDNSRRLVAQDTPKAAGAFDDVVKSVLGAGGQAAGAGAPASSNELARQRLATKIDADFVETPLSDVIRYLSDAVGVQFYFDSVGEQAGVVDQPISFSLKAIPADMVLDLTCRRLGLGYRLRSGVIMISTADNLPYEPEVRVYMVPETSVDELATLIPAMIDVHSWRQSVMGAMSGYCAPQGSAMMYGGMGSAMAAPAAGMPPGMAEAGGGGGRQHNEGTIQVFRGALVISQTPETHQKIEKLLDDLQPVLDKKPTPGSTTPGPVPGTSQRGALQGLINEEFGPTSGRTAPTLTQATVPGATPAVQPGRTRNTPVENAPGATRSRRPVQLTPSTTDPNSPVELNPSNLDNAPPAGGTLPGLPDAALPETTEIAPPTVPQPGPSGLPGAASPAAAPPTTAPPTTAPPAVGPSLGVPPGKLPPATPRR